MEDKSSMLKVQSFLKNLSTVYGLLSGAKLYRLSLRGGRYDRRSNLKRNKIATPFGLAMTCKHNECVCINKRGFTLIETIMVMVIVAILAVVVVVRNPFDAIKLRSAARKVAGDIRYVQKLSISNQTRAGMDFNGDYGYSIYPNITDLTTLAVSPGDPCSTNGANQFVVDFRTGNCSNYSGVTLTAPATDPIAFNSLGTPVDNDGNVIIGDRYVTVTYNGTQQITIAAGTGRVSMP